jgi:hypothetical protein
MFHLSEYLYQSHLALFHLVLFQLFYLLGKSTENQCATASNNYQDAIHSETGNNKIKKTLIEHETAC